MQSEEWRDSPGVSAASAQCYNFFQLAGLVERPAWRNGTSLAFPASDIFTLEGSAVTPACIGLLGMAGALPYCYSEAIARNGGAAAREFMDLLSAPAIDAFCTAWREGRPGPAALPGLPPQRGPLRARALGERLSLALGVPVRIEQFAGHWESLPSAQQSALGSGNARCGTGALLGERLWRLDGSVRVHIGPLDGLALQSFLPGGQGALELASRWRNARGDGNLLAEARIHVLPGARAGMRLGAGACLGHDALLTVREAGERDDLRYRLC
ncbi:type VI secretion system baseplate subunit TssG [Massilia eburnea]|nr:type VI secretion system baseplate subunit TssG [Massilia eburnea]